MMFKHSLFSNFIEIKLKYRKPHIYKLMQFIRFWQMSLQIKHRYNKDRKHFHCSQKSLCDLNIHPPLPSSSISFLSLYVSVHFLEFYINRRIRCVLFCLASFTEYSYLSFVNAVYLFLLFLFLQLEWLCY